MGKRQQLWRQRHVFYSSCRAFVLASGVSVVLPISAPLKLFSAKLLLRFPCAGLKDMRIDEQVRIRSVKTADVSGRINFILRPGTNASAEWPATV